ncbi:hypothetical protein NLI96_g11467 [Meripilus lineatus]|uniref:CHK kinase-like domain-containing protein n=1 Tax=Meripilus lineatus TaxID=2056292 RepID=A0AAD5UVU7_9APHY|nr:hypothetical protein NLI96_g11467 [Physisporinus lineatus]
MLSEEDINAILPEEFNLTSSKTIATLWSNYGRIYRLKLSNDAPKTLILKSIHPPATSLADSDESHLRKLLSYEVEKWFYHHLASRLPSSVKVARSYAARGNDDGNLILEDLEVDFPSPAYGSLGNEAMECVLTWLAVFHATFFRFHRVGSWNFTPSPNEFRKFIVTGRTVRGVWQRGTYWYLETRRDELGDTNDPEYAWLKPWIEKASHLLGHLLISVLSIPQVNDATESEIRQYGTLVHGDAKDANILFNQPPQRGRGRNHQQEDETSVPLQCALYDFQYVGLGLPVHDLIYFIGTSASRTLLTPTSERILLEWYHATLLTTLRKTHNDPSQVYPFDRFLRHWDLAIVDWYRFMAGWGFWGNANWVERRAREVVTVWEANPANWVFS